VPKTNLFFRKYQFYIGIDTGMKTGVGCWWKEKNEITLIGEYKIHEAMDLVRKAHRYMSAWKMQGSGPGSRACRM